MKLYFTILFTLFLLFSCKVKTTALPLAPFEVQDIPVSKKIELAVNQEYIEGLGLHDSLALYLNQYYKSRSYQPRWINDSLLTSEGSEMLVILNNSTCISIPKNRLFNVNSKNYIQDELMITLNLSRVISDLSLGVIDYNAKTQKSRELIPAFDLDSVMLFKDSIAYELQFLKFGPADSAYQALGKGLYDFVSNFKQDTTSFNIKSIKYDSTNTISKVRAALFSKGYVESVDVDSAAFTNALMKFQEDNSLKPDAVIGKYTSVALNESTFSKTERILLAMDKIRSQPERPDKYIHINIPEYKLRFYINDSLKSEHNVVIGTYENQTPEFTSKLHKIVVYPYWNVPYSISSKEILPSLKRNPDYLSRNNYKIYNKDKEEVDPLTVEWKKIRQNSFPYKVVQDFGPRNSLGIIKFDFYNKYSVYFHDTPAKSLFNVDVRSFSHGCIRTQNPIDLAKNILKRDVRRNRYNKIIPDSLDTLIQRFENYEIKIQDPVPIFIEYSTVARHGDGFKMYIDIYGRDEEYLKIMRQ